MRRRASHSKEISDSLTGEAGSRLHSNPRIFEHCSRAGIETSMSGRQEDDLKMKLRVDKPELISKVTSHPFIFALETVLSLPLSLNLKFLTSSDLMPVKKVESNSAAIEGRFRFLLRHQLSLSVPKKS